MHEARRVVRTEHNYCINQAELKGMRDAGFDEYEFISLGEEADNVCHTCDDLDGERFKIEDAVVGVNCPPMHPFCRCKATTPMETKEDIQADIDRLLDGRSIEDIERELDRQIEEKEKAERKQIEGSQQKLLTNGTDSGRIETDEQKKLKEMRDNGSVTSTINEAVQKRHYRGTNEYNVFLSRGEEKSYFYVPIEDLQKFINDNMATGDVFLSKNQNEANEILFYGKTVGFDTKLQKDTSFVKVFYSKDRTHLSPFTPADEEG